MNLDSSKNQLGFADAVRKIATEDKIATLRHQLAAFTADTFYHVGEELCTIGHKTTSHEGHGEVMAVSLLLRIASQLTGASADLFADGRHYAAAALLRQLVEVEYLAWAF